MADKENTLPVVHSDTDNAPATKAASIVVLSDDDVEKVAGGATALEYALIAGAGAVGANGSSPGHATTWTWGENISIR